MALVVRSRDPVDTLVILFEKVRLFIPDMRCLQCGKEIPEGRKFCSSSCSAKYNNVRRQRHPWTEEQHLKNRKLRKEVVCKYCGKPGKTVCDECKPYVQRVRSFAALGCDCNRCLQDVAKEATKKVISLYIEDRLSAPELWERYRIGYTTLRAYLKSAGLFTRSKEEGAKVGVEEGRIKVSSGPQYRHGTYRTWEGKEIFYRSSYELEYAMHLDEQRIRYNVEDLRIHYFDTQRNEERIAIPDFHLPESNEIVEINSSWTYDEQNMKDKFAAYRKAGFIPRLILDHVEQEI